MNYLIDYSDTFGGRGDDYMINSIGNSVNYNYGAYNFNGGSTSANSTSANSASANSASMPVSAEASQPSQSELMALTFWSCRVCNLCK